VKCATLSKTNCTGQAKAQRAEGRNQRSEDRGQANIQNYPSRVVGGEVAEDFFNRGLCLPSGTAMNNGDLDRIIETIKNVSRKAAKKGIKK
jgi:dTDP-4-amino-4,6-dideoxygalactose transaminase